ncbi:hypothetical protein, partial [Turicimonas muris]|uniref:hypothetical protein n=1 Tax=Turicimonas muris TaxID=1796652 RepID=UPI0025B5E225
HKGVFYENKFSHCQFFRGGNMMFLALSNIVESTLRCDSESFGVGNLPLRSASSVKILASSPQSSGDVLIVIAIVLSPFTNSITKVQQISHIISLIG